MSTASFLYHSSTISFGRVRNCFSPLWSPLYVSVASASPCPSLDTSATKSKPSRFLSAPDQGPDRPPSVLMSSGSVLRFHRYTW